MGKNKIKYEEPSIGVDLPTDYPIIKPKEEEPTTVFWQCLGCGSETSNSRWLGCCSRECMKAWLETNPVNRAAGKI